MKLKDLISIMFADYFLIIKGDSVEKINTYRSDASSRLEKYENDTVVKIVAYDNCIEIGLQ